MTAMIEKQFPSDQLILGCLNTHYGIDVAKLTVLPIGADINASVYSAQAHDQTRYFVKLKHGHNHDIGIEIVGLLQNAGVNQIIASLKTTRGEPTQHVNDFTLIVYPFVDGQNGFYQDLTNNQWIDLGKALRQVHEINVLLSIRGRIRKETYSPKWREAVRAILAHIESNPTSDAIGLKLLNFIRENLPAIQRLMDRAEQLSHNVYNESKYVLCHSDIHAGNVLLDGNDTIYIVDWDEPIMAPKERDLMFIGGGVANVWNRANEEKLFYEGYGNTEVNLALLAYYRHERIVEDIAIYAQELILSTAGGENRSQMYEHFIDMFKPNGVVDIAFKTDERLTT